MKGLLQTGDRCVPLCGWGTAGHSLARDGKGQFRHFLSKTKNFLHLKSSGGFFPGQGHLLKHKEVEQMCLVGVEFNHCCETLHI